MHYTEIQVKNYELKPSQIPAGTAGSYGNEGLAFNFSQEWENLHKTVTFFPEGKAPVALLVEDGKIELPAEATATAGKLPFTLRGEKEGIRKFSLSGCLLLAPVRKGEGAEAPKPPTPSETEQIRELAEKAAEELQKALEAIEAGKVKGEKGETGPAGPKGDAFTYSDFTADQLAELKGPKGDDGKPGATGPAGPKGDAFTYSDFTEDQLAALKGPKGDDGKTGPAGPKGDAFTYADFTTEQLEALKGPKGDDGTPGATGPKGDAFTYNDFTEDQLAALKGPKGDPGEDGKTGPQGAVGPAGPQGTQGINELQLSDLAINFGSAKFNSTNEIVVDFANTDATTAITVARTFAAGTYTVNLSGENVVLLLSFSFPSSSYNEFYTRYGTPYFRSVSYPFTFTAPEDFKIAFRLTKAQTITGLKLEKGTVPAPVWTPAIPDLVGFPLRVVDSLPASPENGTVYLVY